MSLEQDDPTPSEWALVRKAQQALDQQERERQRWERERQWDQAVKDVAAMTLVVNALSAEVRDNCMKKSTYSKPLKWFAGIFLTAIMVPAAAWIWAFLSRVHITPG
jgi:hypothetical protein